MKSFTINGISGVPANGLMSISEHLIEGDPYPVIGPTKDEAKSLGGSGKVGVDDIPVNVKPQTIIPSHADGIDKLVNEDLSKYNKITRKLNLSEKNLNLDSLFKKTKEVQVREMRADYHQPKDKYEGLSAKNILEDVLPALRENKQQSEPTKYAGGKISTFGRMFPAIASLSAGLGLLAHWGTNSVNYHNTYAENPYSTLALGELNKLRHNPYPEIQASQDAERRAAYANELAGGLSGGQKYLGRIALGIGGMRNAANIYANAQQQNNAYRSQYANALLQEGNSIASRRQNANQHDWSDFVAAHGAKTRGIEQATANIIGAINGAYQNEFKYRTWQDTLDMYRDNQELDRERLNADIEAAKARNTANYRYFTPTYSYNFNLNDPWEGYLNTNPYNSALYSGFNIKLNPPGKHNCGKDRKR